MASTRQLVVLRAVPSSLVIPVSRRRVRLSGRGTLQVLMSTARWIALARIMVTSGREMLAGYAIAIRVEGASLRRRAPICNDVPVSRHAVSTGREQHGSRACSILLHREQDLYVGRRSIPTASPCPLMTVVLYRFR